MYYRNKNYWPAIYLVAGFSGLCALTCAALLAKALFMADSTTSNPTLLFLLLSMGFLITAGGCIGTIKQKWWGRGILTFFSVIYLLAFPIGTILAFFVLRGLSIHKNEFK